MSTNIVEEMEQEDVRCREQIKEACYTVSEEALQERVERVLAESKRRQYEIFRRYYPQQVGASVG